MAARCGCRYGLLLPHGTDALRLALAALFDHDGLEYGGEVIVPNYSFIASATAPLDRRFGIALVDVDPGTLLLDPKRVEEAIVPGKTRAILPVHLFGQPADMTALCAIARRHNLKILEDAAQAHGAEWETGPVGSLGDAAGFSFQSHKSLSCGEGGILTTNDEEVFDRAYRLHDVGRSRIGRGRWDHHALGWNCRPTEYQAAVLLYRLTQFDRQQSIRRENFARLRSLLTDLPCVEPLAVRPGVKRHGMYMFPLRYRPEHCGGASFEDFLHAVQAEGMPIHRAFSTTLSAQPAIERLLEKRPAGTCAGATDARFGPGHWRERTYISARCLSGYTPATWKRSQPPCAKSPSIFVVGPEMIVPPSASARSMSVSAAPVPGRRGAELGS